MPAYTKFTYLSVVRDALVAGKKVLNSFTKCVTLPAGATDTDYDGVVYIANEPVELIAATARQLVAGTDGSAVTLMVKKVASATAPSAGTDMLSAGLNLKTAANTNQTGALSATAANLKLAIGDAVALVSTGALTSVDGVTVSLVFKRS